MAQVGRERRLGEALDAIPARPLAADLLLLGLLAGVEGNGLGRGLVRVGIELRSREPERVVGRLVDRVGEHHHLVALALPAQPYVAEPAPGRTVRAKAVGGEARQAGTDVPPALQGRGEGGAGLGGVVAAEVEVEFKLALACRAAEQGDHAARAVAVERREGPAQDLDALGAGQVEVGDLARAVGHGGRDAIGVETQAPHAEARARTEAARADLQVLRVVVAVVDGEAGHALQRFREVHHQAACAYLLGVHHGDGVGRVEDTGLDARAGHDHGFELLGLARWSLRRARAREPQEGD